MAKILDGNALSKTIRGEVAAEVAKLKTERGVTAGLAVVLVGDNPASAIYVRNKGRACEEVGMFSETIRMPQETTQAQLLAVLDRLNNDTRFHGILVQLPLPKQINERDILLHISPDKDADCLHPYNVGRLVEGSGQLMPCTPHGVQQILVRYGYDPAGKHVVICGRSNIVGKPLVNMMLQKRAGANATVTLCHTGTKDLPSITRQADIVVAAMGVPEFIKGDMVRQGAVVIDVGINRIPDANSKSGSRMVGDVHFASVEPKAEAITPVPGGVGPMTIAMLLVNTLTAAKLAARD